MLESSILAGNIAILFLAFIGQLAGSLFNVNLFNKIGRLLLFTSFILLTISLASRWYLTGRPPVYGTYESMILGSFATFLVYFIFRVKLDSDAFEILISVLVMFMLAYGVFSNKTPAVLGLAFKSKWLWFHIGFAWLAYASFLIAALFAILNLISDKASALWIRKKLEKDQADNLSFKLITFGFITHTVEIVSGALWANDLYGKYWRWDPIETWSLIVWLIYATYLHLRITLGWEGRKISAIAALSPIYLFVTYGGIIFLNGVHGPLF